MLLRGGGLVEWWVAEDETELITEMRVFPMSGAVVRLNCSHKWESISTGRRNGVWNSAHFDLMDMDVNILLSSHLKADSLPAYPYMITTDMLVTVISVTISSDSLWSAFHSSICSDLLPRGEDLNGKGLEAIEKSCAWVRYFEDII